MSKVRASTRLGTWACASILSQLRRLLRSPDRSGETEHAPLPHLDIETPLTRRSPLPETAAEAPAIHALAGRFGTAGWDDVRARIAVHIMALSEP